MIKIVLVLLLLSPLVARAAVSCGDLLSFASSDVSAETKELSPAARSYVNLIKFYIGESNGELDSRAADAIFASKAFINPFARRPDSLSHQITNAMKQIQSKVNPQDWLQVQAAIKQLVQDKKVEAADRQEKETDTSWISDPHMAYEDTLHPITDPRTQWLRVNSRVFYATTQKIEGRLSVFEMVNGFSKLIAHTDEQYTVKGPITMKMVGDRLLLAARSASVEIYVFEVIGNSIQLRASKQLLHQVSVPMEWQVVDGRIFLAVSIVRIYLFEFVDDRLEERSKPNVSLPAYAASAWQVIGGRVLLAVGAHSDLLHIYELIDGRLKLVTTFAEVARASSTPAWQVIDGRIFISIASDMNRSYLIEFVDDKLELRDKLQFPFVVQKPPIWTEKDGRHFLVLAGWRDILVYEFANAKLVPRKQFAADERIDVAAVDLGEDPDRLPVRFLTQEKNILVVELFKELKK